MTPSPDTERRYTIRQWEKLKGIKILDPDGFNRKNPDLMECLFTEQEFDEGAMGSTIEIKAPTSPTENTEELDELDTFIDDIGVLRPYTRVTKEAKRRLHKLVASREHQAVQAFGEKVLKEENVATVWIDERCIEVIPVSVITSLMEGGVK